MERLTHREEDGKVYFKDYKGYSICNFSKEIDRLAAYEETGLTPEEVKSLHNKYGLLLTMYHKLQKDCDSWMMDARKWAAELGEDKIAKCYEGMDPKEVALKMVLDREAKRIKGDAD